MKVWTMTYNPFNLGGSLWTPVACQVDRIKGPYDIGKGFTAYLVEAPNGKTFVAEAESGAFIGPSVEEVRADVEAGTVEVMRQQVDDAKEKGARAKTVATDDFWKLLKCQK